MTSPIYIALIHYPVLNKQGDIVTTSLTNFDIHDLGRTSATFGVEKCFMVTPVEAQIKMVDYIKKYWREGVGERYNPDRSEAFKNIEVCKDLNETCLTIEKLHGTPAKLVATSARESKKPILFKELRGQIASSHQPVLLLFGTGWGLSPEIIDRCDGVLEPIRGLKGYNHLPVRAAVAIILDRLLSPHDEESGFASSEMGGSLHRERSEREGIK